MKIYLQKVLDFAFMGYFELFRPETEKPADLLSVREVFCDNSVLLNFTQ